MSNEKQIFEDIISKYKNELNVLLNGQSKLNKYCYEKGYSKEYGTFDKNHLNRYRITEAIRFSPEINSKNLENIIRALFIEEIKDRETDSWQGMTDTLEILIMCLKKYNKTDDIELFKRAKNANFDTYCGLAIDIIDDTFIKRNINDLDIIDYMYILQDLEEYHALSELLNIWQNSVIDWNESNYSLLAYFAKSVNDIDTELTALRKIVDLSYQNNKSYQNSNSKKYLEALVRNKKFTDSIKFIDEIINAGFNIYNRNESHFIECCADIIINNKDKTQNKKLWKYIKNFFKINGYKFHFNLIKKSKIAAKIVNDIKLYEKLKKIKKIKIL